MGNGNVINAFVPGPLVDLLTPHGEREPKTISPSLLLRCPPNPSWGTGTGRRCREVRRPRQLLTPHGEREHGNIVPTADEMRTS